MSTTSVALHPGWLRVTFSDGTHGDFHDRWLRHNSDNDRHPKTGERILCSSELADDLRVVAAHIDGEALVVRFSDDSPASSFPLGWLETSAYAVGRAAVPPPPSDVPTFTLRATDFSDLASLTSAALARVRRDGIAIVRAAAGSVLGATSEAAAEATERLVSAFEGNGTDVIETHFGRIEDLRPDNTTNKNTDQLGYTDAAIHLHTDQPFIPKPPRYQILQSILPSDNGGDSMFVDALAAWRYLHDLERHDAELLRTVPVHFHRKQKAFESLVVAPIIAWPDDAAHDLGTFQVRYSYFTMAPHRVPFGEMSAWYRAYDRFARLVRDPVNQVRTRLGAGDFVIYDNHRMLHARTSFVGSRWLRGIYLEPKG